MRILLVFRTYVYYDARFWKCKVYPIPYSGSVKFSTLAYGACLLSCFLRYWHLSHLLDFAPHMTLPDNYKWLCYLCITVWCWAPQFQTQNSVILLSFSCYKLKSNVKNAYSIKITICGHAKCVTNKQLAKNTHFTLR